MNLKKKKTHNTLTEVFWEISWTEIYSSYL